MRDPQEFADLAAVNNIEKWLVHNCSMCGYECGFQFYNNKVFYDNGCDCVTYYNPPQRKEWKDVADYYNMQTNVSYIKEMDEFWGFKND